MKTALDIQNLAKRTILNEANAIHGLVDQLNLDFANVVLAILRSKGRVIFTGIGKSAHIAQKIVSTLNSTGTPSLFMHAAEAIHGDLGNIQKDDLVVCISKSGETPEIKVLIPLIKSFGNPLIALVGNPDSYLAKHSNYVLLCQVKSEACPNNLAPTASTTAQLVMGDALAVALLECRGFSSNDFAKFHPGGSLGKQLYMKVSDLSGQNEKPMVQEDSPIKSVIIEISAKRLGVTAVMQKESLIGIITDGDLRRMLLKGLSIETTLAKDIMSPSPKCVKVNDLAIDALCLMRNNNITQALVINETGEYQGVVHVHDILKEGII